MKKQLINLSKNSFVQGGFFLTASSFTAGFLNYLFNIFAARALGPEGYGEIAALFAYTVVLSIPMGTITSLLIQKIGSAENSKEYAVAVHSWIVEKTKRWWYLIFGVVVATPFIPSVTNLSPISGYILPIIMLVSFASAYYTGALQRQHIFFFFSVISIGRVFVKFTGAVLALYWFGGLEIILIFLVLSGIISLLFNHLIFLKYVQTKSSPIMIKNHKIRKIFKDRQLWLTTGVTGALALMNNVDIMFTKKFFDAEQAGLYSSWALFAKIIFYVLGPILTIAFIFFSSKKYEIKHRIVFIIIFTFFVFIGAAAILGYDAFGRLIVDSLFGKDFWGVIPYLKWAAYFGTGYTLMTFMMYFFLAKKSKLSLLPVILFPVYLIILLNFSRVISDVMYISTFYTYINIAVFLLIFFKNRLLFIIR